MSKPKTATMNGNEDFEAKLVEAYPELAETFHAKPEGGDWVTLSSSASFWAHASKVPCVGVIHGVVRKLERKGENDPAKKFFDAAIVRLTKATLVGSDDGAVMTTNAKGKGQATRLAKAGEDVLVVLTTGLRTPAVEKLIEVAESKGEFLPLVRFSLTGVKELMGDKTLLEFRVDIAREVVSRDTFLPEAVRELMEAARANTEAKALPGYDSRIGTRQIPS